jgi:tRNA threonylcarbamoyladenosine biosynthesis protein TsaB
MLVLALDTCFGACSVALFESTGARVIASLSEPMEKGQAEAIGPMVAAIFQKSGCTPADVGKVAVTCGPGTFTGLRIGLAFAQGFSTATGAGIVGIDTLTATAAPFLVREKCLAVLHVAGATGNYYGAAFVDGVLTSGPAYTDLETFLETLPLRPCSVLGTGATAAATAHPASFVPLADAEGPKAEAFAPHAVQMEAQDGPLQPIYLRDADAKPPLPKATTEFRSANAHDLRQLARLHQMSFTPGWSSDSLSSTLELAGVEALTAVVDGQVRAFIISQAVADECEILTLCTEPRWRHRGLARRLVEAMLKKQQSVICHLEVASDNTVALGLYRSLGFSETGRRKAYYSRPDGPPVDAITMSRRQ